MIRFFYFLFLLLLLTKIEDISISAKNINQGAAPPIIDIKPDSFYVSISEGKFLTRNVKVLNRGGEPLYIKSITSSCQCGSSKILSGKVEPLGIGKIQLSVNTEGLYDGNNIVEFVVNSTAINTPTQIKFVIDTTSIDSIDSILQK